MHETEVRVRWGELDAYEHVNHAVYLSYMEAARIEALESIGWGMERLAAEDARIVVAEITVRFRQSAGNGDQLTITTRLREVRPASMRWQQTITRRGVLVVEMDLIAAATGPTGRPVRIPAAFRSALDALAG